MIFLVFWFILSEKKQRKNFFFFYICLDYPPPHYVVDPKVNRLQALQMQTHTCEGEYSGALGSRG